MRLRDLKKLIARGAVLDYANAYEVPDVAVQDGTIQMPQDATVSNLIVAQFDNGTDGVSIVTDAMTLVALPGADLGYVTLQAEIPPGAGYATLVDGAGSSVTSIREVPRR